MMIQSTSDKTRQVIEARAKGETNEHILRRLREAWKVAPIGACNLIGHEDRPAVEAVRVVGGHIHNCAECAPRHTAMRERNDRQERARRSAAAAGGLRAQTFHRQ